MSTVDKKIKRLTNWFPRLKTDKMFKITSHVTRNYNCLSWGCNNKQRWTWPNEDGHEPEIGEYWPEGIPNDSTPTSFIRMFETEGFTLCSDASVEHGYEKLAIYVNDGLCTHAARQLPNGLWTSKLGYWEDIQHSTPQSLEGDLYGNVHCYMKRPTPKE